MKLMPKLIKYKVGDHNNKLRYTRRKELLNFFETRIKGN